MQELCAVRFALCDCHQEAIELACVFLDLLGDIEAAQGSQQQQRWQLMHKSLLDDPQGDSQSEGIHMYIMGSKFDRVNARGKF